MHLNTFLQDIVDNLKEVEGLQAIVLGGSRASDTQRPDSDIDLGLYYNDVSPLDIDHIRRICIELNDTPDPVVTNIGEWGKWVNGGAWLTIQEQQVDFLYRNIDFVSKILDDCNRGETQFDYLQQPPHGFYSYIYCAETHICKILYDPIGAIQKLKSKVTDYSQALRYKIINRFLWDAEFSLYFAKKSARRGEVYAVTGILQELQATWFRFSTHSTKHTL